jgi:hypothetical protein
MVTENTKLGLDIEVRNFFDITENKNNNIIEQGLLCQAFHSSAAQ